MVLRYRDSDNNGTLDERHYVMQDAHFNVTGITNTSGTVQERYVYDPYGALTYLTGNWGSRSSTLYNWLYNHQGGRFDTATHIVDFRHRAYFVDLGRWAQQDPISFAGGSTNVYSYAYNSPITTLDSYGLKGDAILSSSPGKIVDQPLYAIPPTITLPVSGVFLPFPWLPPIEYNGDKKLASNCGGAALGVDGNIGWSIKCDFDTPITNKDKKDKEWQEMTNLVPKGCVRVDCAGVSVYSSRCDCSKGQDLELYAILYITNFGDEKNPVWRPGFHILGRDNVGPWRTQIGGAGDDTRPLVMVTDPLKHTKNRYERVDQSNTVVAPPICLCCKKKEMEVLPIVR